VTKFEKNMPIWSSCETTKVDN